VNAGFDLRSTFLFLVALLERTGVAHAFIGALPVLAWGRVRATTDLDVVVLAETGWSRLQAELAASGFHAVKTVGPADRADALPDLVMFRGSGRGPVRVDVFLAKTDFEREVVQTARVAEVLGVQVRLARPEASIIYKLIAARPKDLDDVEGIFAARRSAGEELDWAFLERWASAWEVGDALASFRGRFG
jgi:hypothetical protein